MHVAKCIIVILFSFDRLLIYALCTYIKPVVYEMIYLVYANPGVYLFVCGCISMISGGSCGKTSLVAALWPSILCGHVESCTYVRT